MIKFFRHVRQRLLSESKFSKYLIYAFGEIILVVIGILIALQINNWNDNRKSRVRINQILKKVHEELALNIDNSNDLTSFYSAKEGNIGKVLRKEVSKQDYHNPGLVYLIWNSSTLDLSDNVAKELDGFTELLNKEQNELVSRINQLYSVKPTLDAMDAEIEKAVSDFDARLKGTTNWYYLSNNPSNLPEVAYDYFLNDTLYLNDVAYYESEGLENHFKYNTFFNTNAKELYIDLSHYLKLEIDTSLIEPIDRFKYLMGTYALQNSVEKDTLTIRALNDRIIYEQVSKNDLVTSPLFPESEDKFVLGVQFAQLLRDENNQPIGLKLTLGSGPMREYVKIN